MCPCARHLLAGKTTHKPKSIIWLVGWLTRDRWSDSIYAQYWSTKLKHNAQKALHSTTVFYYAPACQLRRGLCRHTGLCYSAVHWLRGPWLRNISRRGTPGLAMYFQCFLVFDCIASCSPCILSHVCLFYFICDAFHRMSTYVYVYENMFNVCHRVSADFIVFKALRAFFACWYLIACSTYFSVCYCMFSTCSFILAKYIQMAWAYTNIHKYMKVHWTLW